MRSVIVLFILSVVCAVLASSSQVFLQEETSGTASLDLTTQEPTYDQFFAFPETDISASGVVTFNYKNNITTTEKEYMRIFQGDSSYTVTLDGNAVETNHVESIGLVSSGLATVNVGTDPGLFAIQASQKSPLFIYSRVVTIEDPNNAGTQITVFKVTVAVNGQAPQVPAGLASSVVDSTDSFHGDFAYSMIPASSYAFEVDASGNKIATGTDTGNAADDGADDGGADDGGGAFSLEEGTETVEVPSLRFHIYGDTLEFWAQVNAKFQLGRAVREFFPSLTTVPTVANYANITLEKTLESSKAIELNNNWDTLYRLYVNVDGQEASLQAVDTRSLMDRAKEFYDEQPMVVYGIAGGIVLVLVLAIYCCCCKKDTIIVPGGPVGGAPGMGMPMGGMPMGMGGGYPSMGPPMGSMRGGPMGPPMGGMGMRGGYGGW